MITPRLWAIGLERWALRCDRVCLGEAKRVRALLLLALERGGGEEGSAISSEDQYLQSSVDRGARKGTHTLKEIQTFRAQARLDATIATLDASHASCLCLPDVCSLSPI